MKTSLFDFELPEKLIAQAGAKDRTSAKLMILDRKTGRRSFQKFAGITGYLQKGDVLVLNDTRVVPARIHAGRKSGGAVEIMILNEGTGRGKMRLCLLKPLKKIREGEILQIEGNDACRVISKENGRAKIRFFDKPESVMEKYGKLPLPPYIHGSGGDTSLYQTVYAKRPGAVAAPTAGLHFTAELLKKIKKMGVKIVYVTLRVGYGTFTPIRAAKVEDHVMEKEYFSVPAQAAGTINDALKDKRRVIACGTTATRALETCAVKRGNFWRLKSSSGFTGKYIYPPYKFKIVKALITNFHTPSSSLIVLASAFATRKLLLSSYREAVKRGWRFFSFGDCMFIV